MSLGWLPILILWGVIVVVVGTISWVLFLRKRLKREKI